MDRVSQALFSVVATYNDTFFLSFHISVNDLRRLIEKAGGKLDHSLYAQSATHVGSLSHQVSQPNLYNIFFFKLQVL